MPWTRLALLALSGVLCFASRSWSAGETPANPDGQWWQLRGDRRLTGRSAAKGKVTKPAIIWKHPLFARETFVSARLAPSGVGTELPLPDKDLSPPGVSAERLMGDFGAAALGDLEGNGQAKPIWPWAGANSKVGKILPDVPGLQLVTCEPLNYPEREPYRGIVRLKVREKGEWVERWKTETDTLIWQAEPIIGDFDRDKRTDVALLPWHKMNVLDAASGRVTHQGAFKREDETPELGGRAYGFFGAFDLDGQGRDEFVIIDDFVHHMAVMGWRDSGTLERLWNRNLHKPGEVLPTPAETVALVPNPEPVQDLDGDGRREVIVSIYNETRDQRWHTLVFDGMSGTVKHDLPGWFVSGVRDLDGDGLAELLCTETAAGMRRPEPAALKALTFKGGKPSALWTDDGAAFQTADLPDLPPNVNSGTASPKRTVLCGPIEAGGRPVFFTRRVKNLAAGNVELSAWRSDEKRQVQRIGTLSGPRLEVLAVHASSGVLIRTATLDGESGAKVSGQDFACEVRLSRPLAAPSSPVVVGRMERGAAPVVIVQGAEETVEAVRPRVDGSVERVWRVPGRAMTCANYYEGALLADLAGDGSLAAVIGTRGEADCARVAAIDARGRTIWHRDFPEFPGTPPPWNVPGLMYWQGGYFRDAKRMDLLVQMRRVGGEAYLLDGRTGERLWSRTHATDERDFGRTWLTIFDYNRDGREDALTNQPDVFCVADGATGELLLKKHAIDLVPGQGYWGTTVVGDFLRDGTEQMLYSNPTAIALLRVDGKRVWTTPFHAKEPCHPYHGTDVRPVTGDSDGDGRLELFVPGFKCAGKRELLCFDAVTGATKWRLSLPDKPTEPAVCDIDNDGRDECLFTIATTLYCVGGAGQVEWTLALPHYASSVAIADVLGDGHAQIVVSCQDGHVYGIDQPK